ncbi:MAG: hypothetical protein JWM76_4021 [Pseudonocardiales bacterium]|nr:hypothetical protein [Pseudonocardiales bacterium]
MSNTQLLIILALVGYAIYKMTRTSEVTGKARFKLALIYSIVGISLGVHVGHEPATLGLVALSLAASVVVGLIRGRHNKLWRDADGRIYSRGTKATISMFLGLVAFKFVLGTVAYLTHTPYESGIGEVLLMVGLMLAMQAEITWRRAQALRAEAGSASDLGSGSDSGAATANVLVAGRH